MKKHLFTFLLLFVFSGILSVHSQGIVVYGEPTDLAYRHEPFTGKSDHGIVLLSEQYTVSINVVNPTLRFSDPSYVTNGSLTATVINGTCIGTYTVTASPIAGSGPEGSTPPFTTVTGYFGFGQGSFLFPDAGYGSYLISVTETGPCSPPIDPVITQVDILEPVPVPISQWSIIAAFALILGYSVFAFRRLF